jgi:hypothetical protein
MLSPSMYCNASTLQNLIVGLQPLGEGRPSGDNNLPICILGTASGDQNPTALHCRPSICHLILSGGVHEIIGRQRVVIGTTTTSPDMGSGDGGIYQWREG